MNKQIHIDDLLAGDFKTLARAITLVENDTPEGRELLLSLPFNKQVPLIGITGPPGAGKSSLVNALMNKLISEGKHIGVIAVDPSSPFNFGSLLGDRIRMSEHFNSKQVYIRSVSARGSLGGLSARIYEISDVMKHAGFDLILVETVGVGQSEVEIAGLADTTVVVLVPEAGDEVQTLKSGLMEIADVFVVNKADREGAAGFAKNLSALVHSRAYSGWEIPVLQTIASSGAGIEALWTALEQHGQMNSNANRKLQLLTEKAYQLILQNRMSGLSKQELLTGLQLESNKSGFNLYQYLKRQYFK